MIRRSAILFGLAALLVAGVSAAESGPDIRSFPDPAAFETGSRQWLRASEALKWRPLVDSRLADNCDHSYDVLHYNITLDIDFDNEMIYGDTWITSLSQEAGLDSIDLDFTVLAVDSVLDEAGLLTYDYDDPVLTVYLGQTYAPGDTFQVRVVYHGQPGNEGPDGFGGFYFDGVPTHAFQMGVGLVADPPSMGKFWFPCWDWPCDKATAEYHVTVPGLGKRVICNGEFLGSVEDSVNIEETFHWQHDFEIAPHVMTVNAGKYAEMVDSTYDWIYYWPYPRDTDAAGIHFQNVDIMMDGFIDLYGPYPYEKFGYVAASKGDMEHQTCVTHVTSVINPNHLYDWLLAHEMAHQWWGDCVSVADWRDLWLSEGFATYSEAIFQEYAYGTAAYEDYVENHLMSTVFASGENFPIYDPLVLWGTTTYEKGACVLHMLRHVVGDSVFFDGLAAYRAAHEHSSATTPEFQAAMEGVCGFDLSWFFQEWIYDVGWPEYEYSWRGEANGPDWDLNIVVDQVQINGPVYTMPVDFKVSTASGDTVVQLWVDEEREDTTLAIPEEPLGVEIDPANWILDISTEVPHAGVPERGETPGFSLSAIGPNPFTTGTVLAYSVPRVQHVTLTVYDTQGRKVATLIDHEVKAGRGEAAWNGTDDAGREVASGNYFCCLSTEDGNLIRRLVLLR
jgi:aminopeptidase N